MGLPSPSESEEEDAIILQGWAGKKKCERTSAADMKGGRQVADRSNSKKRARPSDDSDEEEEEDAKLGARTFDFSEEGSGSGEEGGEDASPPPASSDADDEDIPDLIDEGDEEDEDPAQMAEEDSDEDPSAGSDGDTDRGAVGSQVRDHERVLRGVGGKGWGMPTTRHTHAHTQVACCMLVWLPHYFTASSTDVQHVLHKLGRSSATKGRKGPNAAQHQSKKQKHGKKKSSVFASADDYADVLAEFERQQQQQGGQEGDVGSARQHRHKKHKGKAAVSSGKARSRITLTEPDVAFVVDPICSQSLKEANLLN
eukprot:1159846-Pelagomonas_calceolata.AAC.1